MNKNREEGNIYLFPSVLVPPEAKAASRSRSMKANNGMNNGKVIWDDRSDQIPEGRDT